MGLLLISTSFPEKHADGKEAAGSFVADFASTLSQQVPVTVLAPGRSASDDMLGKLRIHRFAGAGRPLSVLNPLNPVHWPAITVILKRGAEAARLLMREQRFDHILALWALPSGYWAYQLARRHNLRFSVWCLGSDIWALKRLPLIRGVLKRVLHRADVRFADGHLLEKDVERLAGRPCHFLPSVRRLPPRPDKALRADPPYRVAYLGRWHRNKGTDLLLDALAQLRPDDWGRIEAVRVYGGGPLASVVQAGAAALQAAGHPVNTYGYIDKEGAADVFAWADLLVIPSRIESIPVIFSDAIQAGCPVVATPVGDLPHLMSRHQVGVLAGAVNAAALAAALRAATSRSLLEFEQGLAALRQNLSVESAVDSFLRLSGLSGNR